MEGKGGKGRGLDSRRERHEAMKDSAQWLTEQLLFVGTRVFKAPSKRFEEPCV